MRDVREGVQLELPFPKPAAPAETTAFLVIVKADGSAIATGDLTPPAISRPPTLADMRRACMEVTADIAASQAADAVMQTMAQAAANNAAELQAAQIRANLERRR